MTLPDIPTAAGEPSLPGPMARRRVRRRRGQLSIPADAQGRSALLSALARRAYPSYELFTRAALCGTILAIGFTLDSQALLLFGILLAPILSPWVGLLLATITGSIRFFVDTLMALLLSAAVVLLLGTLAGLIAKSLLPHTFNEAYVHSRLWWPDLAVLALAAAMLTVSFARSEAKPFVPSAVLAYEFFLPLGAAGFGLGSGLPEIWPQGVLVFLVHFGWAGMFGLLTLVALHLVPTNLKAFLFSAAVALLLLVILVVLMTGGTWMLNPSPSSAAATQAAPVPSALPVASGAGSPIQPTSVLQGETSTSTATPESTPAALFVGATLTPTIASPTTTPTIQPTLTPAPASPTVILTIEPTSVYALIHASQGGGAVLRETPGGKGLTVLDNFEYVQLLTETQDVSGFTWVHVISTHNGVRLEGWVAQPYLEVPASPTP